MFLGPFDFVSKQEDTFRFPPLISVEWSNASYPLGNMQQTLVMCFDGVMGRASMHT